MSNLGCSYGPGGCALEVVQQSIPGLAAPPPACLLSTTGQGAPDGPSSELGLSCSATHPSPESFQLRWLDPPHRASSGVPENLLFS